MSPLKYHRHPGPSTRTWPLPTGRSPSIVSSEKRGPRRRTAASAREAEALMAATTCCLVGPATYRDSVELMRVAALIEKLPGVSRAALMMATSANRELLSGARLLDTKGAAAGPNDLVVAVAAADPAAADRALV